MVRQRVVSEGCQKVSSILGNEPTYPMQLEYRPTGDEVDPDMVKTYRHASIGI